VETISSAVPLTHLFQLAAGMGTAMVSVMGEGIAWKKWWRLDLIVRIVKTTITRQHAALSTP
jgi:hypothetical protein